MESIINKLKPVFLLLSMSLVCVGIVWVTNQLRSSSNYVSEQERVMQSPVISATEETPSIVQDTSEPTEVKESDDESVLGVGSTQGYQCSNKAATYIKSQSVCERASSETVMFGNNIAEVVGLKVSVKANIVLTKVTVPLELLSGVEVADSNRLITSKTPTLKAAGEQIDEMSANVLLPPGKQIDSYKGWEADKPFQFDFKTAFANLDEDDFSQESQIRVDRKLSNECEDCNNASNVNPDKSNKMSEFMLDSIYRYPGEKATVEQEELIEKCGDKDQFYTWEGNWDACTLGVVAKNFERIKNLLSEDALSNWLECNPVNPLSWNKEECIAIEDVVIIMASPFGADTDCVDGVCTNAYMNRRNTTLLEPGADLGGKHYYVTPCKAFISGFGKEMEVKCAWDMSHLFKERKVNEFDDAPGVDSTPSDSAYNQFLLEQVQGQRGEDSLVNL